MGKIFLYLSIASLATVASTKATESRPFAVASISTENEAMYRPVRKTVAETSQEWAGLSDAQIQRKAKAIVGMQVMRFIKMRCQPNGKNATPIESDLNLSFRSDGFLLKVVSKNDPKNIGLPDNERQKCIIEAVRMASPYHGLDPKYYNIWKSLLLRLRTRG